MLNRELVLSVIFLWWKVSFYEKQSLFSNIRNWRHKQNEKNALSPTRGLFWMTSELPVCDSWKNSSYRYLIISKDFIYLGKAIWRRMVIEHVPTHWVWIITTSVNVCLLCLLRLKFDALWFCHLKSLCKSLYHSKYITVIIWCWVCVWINFCHQGTIPVLRESWWQIPGSPRLRLKSWAPPFFCLYITWLR